MSWGVLRFPMLLRLLRPNCSTILAQGLQQCRRAGRGPVGTFGDDAKRVKSGIPWACACGDVVGQECDLENQSCPLHLMIETPKGPVRLTMPVMR